MRRALVTGGSGDIGEAICHRLVADGHEVLVHANSRPERAQALVADLRGKGGEADTVVFDITDAQATERALEDLLARGAISILVSNAGIHDDAPMAGMELEQWRRVIDVSLNGFYNVCKPLLMPMIRARWGRIIAMSSVAGQIGNRGQANYAAAKSGLHGAVRSLSLELASRGITANAVAPGVIAGGMAAAQFTQQDIERLVPAKRAGQPDDVAGLVSFLASDSAGYITGQVIGVNGGMA